MFSHHQQDPEAQAHRRQSKWLLLVIALLLAFIVSEVATQLIQRFTDVNLDSASMRAASSPLWRAYVRSPSP